MDFRHVEEKHGKHSLACTCLTPSEVDRYFIFCSCQSTHLSTSILIKKKRCWKHAQVLVSQLSMLLIPSLCCGLPWPPSSRPNLLVGKWGDSLAVRRRHMSFLVAHSCETRNQALLVKSKQKATGTSVTLLLNAAFLFLCNLLWRLQLLFAQIWCSVSSTEV